MVKKKLDNLGRNIRRRRNSATGFDGKAGRPRKKREDEREDEGESVSEQHPTSSKEIDVIDLVSKPHEIPSFEAESSSTQPPPQSSTTTISSQKLAPLIPQIPEEEIRHLPSLPVPKSNQSHSDDLGQSITETKDIEGRMAIRLRSEDYVVDIDSLHDWM